MKWWWVNWRNKAIHPREREADPSAPLLSHFKFATYCHSTYHILYSRKFSRNSIFVDGRSLLFRRLKFVDLCTHAHCVLYNQAYFTGLMFAVRRSSVKTAKIGPLENFPLYSSLSCQLDHSSVILMSKHCLPTYSHLASITKLKICLQ